MAWVEERTLRYLQDTAMAMSLMESYIDDSDEKRLTVSRLQATVSDFIVELEKFDLTDGEILQILNLLPKEQVDLHLIIQECESRFDEQKREDLINLIAKYSENTVENDDGGACIVPVKDEDMDDELLME